uniref:Branched-chain-amino-acid aminotransferase-like protein 1 n=1 Tax=Aegilops tauschii TaxID=37682 RepID=R7WGC9_AEGTA
MDRLFDSTKTMAFSNVPSRDWIQDAIFKTLNANGMFSNAHDSARIEGNLAQAEDAIMLDQDGFVSETNATNIFMVRKGIVLTPHADYCLPGITHATVNLFIFHIEIIGANLQNTWIDCLILQKLWPSAMCPVVIG